MGYNPSKSNQRAITRKKLIYYLKLVDTKTNLELARLGDLHSSGILLLSNDPLPLNTTYSILLELPKSLKNSTTDGNLHLSIETLWTKPGPQNASYHETGTRFVAPLNKRQREVINQIIDVFAMPEN